MAITNANIYSESYSVVKTFLESISGLDTKKRYKKDWIHASMPHINGSDFNGYPFITIQIDNSEDKPSMDHSVTEKTFRVLLTIYAKDPTNLDSISDNIYSNLKDITKLTDFDVTALDSSPVDWELDQKGQKILNRAIGFIARKRI